MQCNYTILKVFGFSQLAIACYGSLYDEGFAYITTLASRLKRRRTVLYPVLAKLEKAGFVKSYKAEPGTLYYVALPLYEALATYQSQQRLACNSLIREQQSRIDYKI